jgi:hypothetical protein
MARGDRRTRGIGRGLERRGNPNDRRPLGGRHGAETAELMASCFALQQTYRKFSPHVWQHIAAPEEILLS